MNNYEILGLNPTANKEDIKKAYRKLCLIYHPDRPNGNDAKFIEIKAAYEQLTNIKPEQVYQQHQQYQHRTEPYYVIYNQGFYGRSGDYVINVGFRNILYISGFDGLSIGRYSWTTYGLTEGTLIIKKEDLIKCNYKFSLKFMPVLGWSSTINFKLERPKTGFEEFIDKLKKLKLWVL